MQVAIHLGAHCTDDDRLLKTLLLNKDILAAQGVSVPGPGRYRGTLVKSVQKLKGAEASEQTQEMLMDAIVEADGTGRVVLSHEDFICVPGRIFDNRMIYEKAAYKPTWLRNVFPGHDVEFFLAIRNPATFIPAAFANKRQTTVDFNTFLGGVEVDDIRWSDVIVSIRENNPECKLTVWCNEDTPLIWPTVARAVAGVGPEVNIRGNFAILRTIMRKDGLLRLKSYLTSHPPVNETQRRRILAAFLEKYAIDDAFDEVIDLPGWTEDLVNDLTRIYEEDIAEIEQMEDVTFLSL